MHGIIISPLRGLKLFLKVCTIIISPLRGSKFGGFDAVWRDHNYCAPSGLKGLLYCHPGLAAWAIVYRPFRALKSHHLMLSSALVPERSRRDQWQTRSPSSSKPLIQIPLRWRGGRREAVGVV